MSGWARIEELAAALVEKSSEPLSHEQAVARVLKTDAGSQAYADYRLEPARSMTALAEEELAIRAAAIARTGVEKSAAVEQAVARYPELAHAANGFRTVVAKSEGAWAEIEARADGLVEKSSEPLSREQAIDRVLKTDAGKRLYAAYVAERGGVA